MCMARRSAQPVEYPIDWRFRQKARAKPLVVNVRFMAGSRCSEIWMQGLAVGREVPLMRRYQAIR